MIRLLTHVPSMSDATSFYRGIGPLGDMLHHGEIKNELQLITVNTYNWATIAMSNCVFIQRPYTKDHVTTIEMCKDQGKKIWVDYDDLLLDVPSDNPSYSVYNKQEIQDSVKKCLMMSDHVSVSTEHLKRQYEKYSNKITLIRNCLPMYMLGWRNKLSPNKRTRSIAWRGSRTHQRDVMTCAREIIELSKDERFFDWIWYFVGDNQWAVTDQMPHNRTIWTEPIDTILYFQEMFKIAPSLLQVPLHESNFNKSKSNIAYLEAVFSGALCLAPDWEEWKHPGCLNYSTPHEYRLHLETVLKGELDIEKTSKQAWEYTQDVFSLRKENQKRINIIKEMIGG